MANWDRKSRKQPHAAAARSFPARLDRWVAVEAIVSSFRYPACQPFTHGNAQRCKLAHAFAQSKAGRKSGTAQGKDRDWTEQHVVPQTQSGDRELLLQCQRFLSAAENINERAATGLRR